MNAALVRALNEDLRRLKADVDALLESTAPGTPSSAHGAGKLRVVVLGASFAGLETAQKIRRYAGSRVDITVVDEKSYLLFVPNLLTEVLADRDPAESLHMPVDKALARDGVQFLLARVQEVDVHRSRVRVLPVERPGARIQTIPYDYLVIALGCRLAYDRIPGFSAHGFALTDTLQANRLRAFLHHRYRGGPIVLGSARFHQGSALHDWIPTVDASCEGPLVEALFSLGTWLTRRTKDHPGPIAFFTPGPTFAVDAGPRIAKKLAQMASQKGYRELSNVGDVARVTRDGVEFADGRQAEAELSLIMPDWEPHPFLRSLPVADDRGFIVSDRTMRNPRHPNVLTVGDAAAATVPKLGYLAHLQSDVVAWQIAEEVGARPPGGTAPSYRPLIDCLGIMGPLQGFFIRTNAWYGGSTEIMKASPVPHALKVLYKTAFFMTRGRIPNWNVTAANFLANHLSFNML